MLSSIWTPSIAAAVVFAIVTTFLFFRARKRYLSLPLLRVLNEGKAPPVGLVVFQRVTKKAWWAPR